MYFQHSIPPIFLIKEFFANRFSKYIPKNNLDYYKLSIAIAEKHCTGDLIKGLMYPTIPMFANADNFAIKPSFIDNGGLQFKEVFYIEVKSILKLKYEINKLDWANSISSDGEIEWKGRLPKWEITENGGELTFKSEKGQWLAKDKNGIVIEPS